MTEHGSDAVNETRGKNKPAGKSPKNRKRKKKPAARKKTARKSARTNTPPPRVHRPRASAAEIANRVGVVARLILEGQARPRHIRRALAEMFGAGELDWYVAADQSERTLPLDIRAVPWRTVERYIQLANLEIQNLADEQRAAAKGKARGRYELALAGAIADEHWDTVRKINRDLVRLDGLEPGQRVRIEGNIENTHSGNVEHTVRPGGSLEERAATVANLFGMAAARRAAARAQETAANN